LKKLFIGNLPYQASEAELQNWFSQAGVKPQTVSIIKDRFSGDSRGFGFVEIEDADVDTAVAACNGQSFLGRTLVVNEARPMTEKPPERGPRKERRASMGGGAGGREMASQRRSRRES